MLKGTPHAVRKVPDRRFSKSSLEECWGFETRANAFGTARA